MGPKNEKKMRKLLHIARIFLRNTTGRKFEPETPFLKQLLKPGATCLHIGASDGRHSYFMSKIIGNGSIFAFEPSSYTFGIFTALNQLHGLKNIKAFNVALSDKAGELELVIPIKTSGRIGHSFSHLAKNSSGEMEQGSAIVEKVKTQTMDDMVQELGINKVDFIRCDTEGSEMGILEGGLGTIARDLPAFLIEIHPVALKEDFGVDPQKVLDFFFELEYRMFVLKDGKITATSELVPGKPWFDYFFIHQSHSNDLPPGIFKDMMNAK